MTDPVRVPSLGQLLGLAWPIVISRSTQVVVGFCDAAMVASLGEPALAATTTGALNTFAIFILPLGVVFIVSSFTSQLFSKGDLAGARRYGWYGLGVAAAAQVLCMVGTLFVPSALGLFDYEPEVRALMTDYLAYRLVSGGAAVGLEALANYYGGLGNTRLPMFANVLAMTLNVGFCWVLIYGHLGLPAMGVKGSGLASSLATGIAFLALFCAFYVGWGAPGGRTSSRLKLAELTRMLRFGLPAGLNWFFEFAAFVFFINVVITGLGTTALAAMMTVFQLNSISFMPAFGLSSAGAILVGQAIGAKGHDVVPRIMRLTLFATSTWQGLVGLLYLAIPTLLLLPFVDAGTDADRFLAVGARMLMLSAAWQLFDAAVSTLSETLRAAGDTAFCLWARVVLAWTIFVPGALISVRWLGGGDLSAMLWLVLYMGLLALTLALRFRSGVWRRLDLAGAGDPLALPP